MPLQSNASSPQGLAAVVAALTEEFAGIDSAEIQRLVHQAADRLSDAKVADFIPLLVHRHARSQLRTRATPIGNP